MTVYQVQGLAVASVLCPNVLRLWLQRERERQNAEQAAAVRHQQLAAQHELAAQQELAAAQGFQLPPSGMPVGLS
jgi:hypothetical protein